MRPSLRLVSNSRWRGKEVFADHVATNKRSDVEQLWREFFSDPSKWRDFRMGKLNPKFPDFKHKDTQESLWLNSKWIPLWVEAKLATIAPGYLESSISSLNQELVLPEEGIIKSSSFTWNQRLSRAAKAGQYKETLELFEQMLRDGVHPDRFTFFPVLSACASLEALEEGRCIHTHIIQNGLELDVFVGSSLIRMYGKCGSIGDAEKVFNQMPMRTVVTWNAMMLGYVNCGEGKKTLDLYQQMKQEELDPDPVTFVQVLNACASVTALEEGRAVHAEIIRRDYKANVRLSNCLVDMYGKCGSIEDAERVFCGMPTKTLATWNAMIQGYVKCGEGQKALELYQQMQLEQVNPDPLTFVAVLNACANVAALEEGRTVHKVIIQRGYATDVFLRSSLVDMYGNCGSIEDAERVFKQMPTRDVVIWTAMLAAYGKHGYAKEAIKHFKQMCEVVEVNELTFVCLLTACSHAGLVHEGLEYFKSMSAVYNISPTVDHYACVVDLLGRANRLGEAKALIMTMPMDPNASVWMSLLGACRAHVDVELGEWCAKRLLELEPENAAGYVLLSEIYVAAGQWENSACKS